ncbi:MAG: hypothetical protein DLM68_17730 [Hyphomicrobiales bacterium]|nr:MAG: hypothetical protein DLM68_17730 [Hyphomicrobiales bacterium]
MPSEQATLLIFQVTIVALFLLNMIITTKTGILLLSSPTMNEHARERILVNQLGGFISLGQILKRARFRDQRSENGPRATRYRPFAQAVIG